MKKKGIHSVDTTGLVQFNRVFDDDQFTKSLIQ